MRQLRARRNISASAEKPSQQRDGKQLFFGYKARIAHQTGKTAYGGRVCVRKVIARNNQRTGFGDIFQAFHFKVITDFKVYPCY